MATTVVSGRVNNAIFDKAAVIIRKAGLTPTEVIQNVWASIAESAEIPAAAQPASASAREEAALARYENLLSTLPARNAAYAHMKDDEILSLKVHDYA